MAKKLWAKELKKAKSDAWRAFCKGLKGIQGTADLGKFLKNKSIPGNCTLERIDGSFSENEEESLELLLLTHFPGEVGVTTGQAEVRLATRSDKQKVVDFITFKKVETTFSNFGDYKSPGKDGIFPVMIKKCFSHLGGHLVNLYKDCIKLSYVPELWRESKVVFIPKVGKTDYSNPKNFRPISLLSFLLKGLERLILWYLEETSLNTGLLHKNLFAYRAGRSTDTALHCIIHKIEKGILGNASGHVITVFLDIDAAFSKAGINCMVKAVRNTGCNPAIADWINFMLSNRTASSTWGNTTKTIEVTKGTPQGGILSPVLWNLIMNELLNEMEINGLGEIFCYADDLAAVFCGPDLSTVLNIAQLTVNRMVSWAIRHGLAFSAAKTVAMHFTRSRKNPNGTLKLAEKEISWVTKFKYLGVTIDNKLSWNEHIDNTKKKALSLLFMLQKCVGQTWGVSPKVTHAIYTSMVRPIIAYGCIAWFNGLNKKTNQNKLRSVQALANRITLSAQKSVLFEAMDILVNILPVDLYLQENVVMAVRRLKVSGDWRRQSGEPERSTALLLDRLASERLPGLTMPGVEERVKRTELDYLTVIPTREESKRVVVTSRDPDTLNCFTDGSKDQQGKSGAAFITKCRKKKFRTQGFFPLGLTTSVYQAETIALTRAAQKLTEIKATELKVNFYVDNQGVIKAINRLEIKDSLINEAKEALNELSRTNDVKIIWIPGHEGYMGNEIADRLAKRAAKTTFYSCGPDLPVNKTFLRNLCRDNLSKIHNERWKNMDKGAHARIFFPEIRPRESRFLLGCNRMNINKLTGLITDHGILNYFQFKLGNALTEECSLCDEDDETGIHVLFQCPALARIRKSEVETGFVTEREIGQISMKKVLDLAKIALRALEK